MHGESASTRRAFLGGAGGLLLLGCSDATSPRDHARHPRAELAAAFDRLEAQLGGRLGVSALDTALDTRSGARVGHRAGERFAMCSTFKALLAACVLARVDQGGMALDERVAYTDRDLLEHAPVTAARLAEGALSVEVLCAAAVEVSDNTAANLLLGRVGGPAGLTAYLRSLGDGVTRLDRDEPTLNTNLAGDPRDTSTPDAMSDVLRTILVEERALRAPSRERLVGWMTASTTGRARLRAGLPADWRAGDKTGTSGNGVANDVAIAWPPGRAPIVISCFVDAPAATGEARNAVHAEVARLVVAAFA